MKVESMSSAPTPRVSPPPPPAASGLDGRLKALYQRQGRLMNLHLDLLYACDLDCHHCYLDEKKRPQASTATIIDILGQAADMGALQVLFSGGEIFLRKDLFTILEAARRLRFHIRLKTHGGNITAGDARRLRELGIAQVDFSVYALDPDVHDGFTQKRGSLERTLRGIDLLVAEGLRVEVKCSVTTHNLGHYRELNEHFEARGIPCTLSAKIRGTNSVTTNTYDLNADFEDKVEVELYRLGQAGGPRTPGVAPAPTESYFCSAGRTMIYVAPDLEVYPCVAYPRPVGDLNVQRLADVWRSEAALADVRRSTRADTHLPGESAPPTVGICGTCPARSQCSYCPGSAYIESAGDALIPPAVVCAAAFAKLEAVTRWEGGERPTPLHATTAKATRSLFPIAVNLGVLRPAGPTAHGGEHAGGCSCG
ncbi:MAG: radical SAM protein [Myxococcales bacterium]|nr:radical SAM protein [Myxococcales bacterium]